MPARSLEKVQNVVNAIVPIASLQPHPDNYNQHPETQLLGLKQSHHDLGQFQSVVVWEQPDNQGYVIVSGHGFVEGAKRDGATEIRADILPASTSPRTIKAILLAANLHQRNSLLDETLLASLLEEQRQFGTDLLSLGSDEETLRQMLQEMDDSSPFGETSDEDEEDSDLLSLSEEKVAPGQSLLYLAFGRYRIPLTDEEFAWLQRRAETYAHETGSYYGFVRSLIHV